MAAWIVRCLGGASLRSWIDGALRHGVRRHRHDRHAELRVAPAQASAMSISRNLHHRGIGRLALGQRNIDWPIVKRFASRRIGGAIGATVLACGRQVIAPLSRSISRLWAADPVRGCALCRRRGNQSAACRSSGFSAAARRHRRRRLGPDRDLHIDWRRPHAAVGDRLGQSDRFLVTVVTSATFASRLGLLDPDPVIPLILGGLIVAPLAGYVTRIIPTRVLDGNGRMPGAGPQRAAHF